MLSKTPACRREIFGIWRCKTLKNPFKNNVSRLNTSPKTQKIACGGLLRAHAERFVIGARPRSFGRRFWIPSTRDPSTRFEVNSIFWEELRTRRRRYAHEKRSQIEGFKIVYNRNNSAVQSSFAIGLGEAGGRLLQWYNVIPSIVDFIAALGFANNSGNPKYHRSSNLVSLCRTPATRTLRLRLLRCLRITCWTLQCILSSLSVLF